MPAAFRCGRPRQRIAHHAAVMLAASPVASNHAQREVRESLVLGFGLCRSPAVGDHGSVSSTTISSYQQACSRHRWEVLDGYNIAAHAFPYSEVTGRVWALKDSQEM
jgi:hypothetical protein